MKSELTILEFVTNVEEWIKVSDDLNGTHKNKQKVDPKHKKWMFDSFDVFQAQLWALLPDPLVKPHRKGVVPVRKIKSKDNDLLGKSIVDVLRELLLDIQRFAKQVERGDHKFKEGESCSKYSERKIAMERADRDLQSRINALVRLMCKKLPRA